jgi:hypothetical protein
VDYKHAAVCTDPQIVPAPQSPVFATQRASVAPLDKQFGHVNGCNWLLRTVSFTSGDDDTC